jgi:hypothetical protein
MSGEWDWDWVERKCTETRKAAAKREDEERILVRDELKRLASEVARLRESLKKYGGHKKGCPMPWKIEGCCECGFVEANEA